MRDVGFIGLPRSWIEHVYGAQDPDGQYELAQRLVGQHIGRHRAAAEGGVRLQPRAPLAGPSRQCRARRVNARAGIDLLLPVIRQVVQGGRCGVRKKSEAIVAHWSIGVPHVQPNA
jgi:hypothetical protein